MRKTQKAKSLSTAQSPAARFGHLNAGAIQRLETQKVAEAANTTALAIINAGRLRDGKQPLKSL